MARDLFPLGIEDVARGLAARKDESEALAKARVPTGARRYRLLRALLWALLGYLVMTGLLRAPRSARALDAPDRLKTAPGTPHYARPHPLHLWKA
jgi:hypothetical protein